MATRTDIVNLYVGYFNRAPDPEGLNYWFEEIESGDMTLAEIAQSFSVQPEAVELYPFLRFPEIVSPEAFITQVYLNLFNREPDAAGLEYWTNQLETGASTVGGAIIDIISGAQNTEAGQDLTTLENKAEAGFNWTLSVASVPGFQYFTRDADGVLQPIPAAEAAAKDVIADVDETAESVEDAAAKTEAFVDALQGGEVPSGGQTMMLSVGADMAVGTSGNDTFVARVAQNDDGEQANQLGTGDLIIGSGGIDTLDAVIQRASALNATPASAIAMETQSVEIMNFTALSEDSGFPGTSVPGFRDQAEVGVNMKFTNAVDVIASIDSDADLIVYNVNTLTESEVYGDRRNTEDLTIRMDHTAGYTAADDNEPREFADPDEFYEDAADLTVLFDQNYLLSGQTSVGEAFFFLLDQDAELALKTGGDAEGRLDDIDKNGLIVRIDGETIRIEFDADLLNPQNPNEVNTHEQFVAALQEPLAELIADGTLPEGTTITLREFDDVLFDANGLRLNQASLQDGSFSDLIPAIVVTTGDGSEVEPLGYTAPNEITGEFNVFGRFSDDFQETPEPIAVDVELFKVGRGQDGGELIIGSMDSDGFNNVSGPGIAVFNVLVQGDETQMSSLAELRSTNNALREVYIDNESGSLAALEIGNSNTINDTGTGLKDVRILDASAFENGLSVSAAVTSEIVSKYLDLSDIGDDADDDDGLFMYNFGTGDDSLWMSLDDANTLFSGTSNREDFDLMVEMGAGDDSVYMEVGRAGIDDEAFGLAWYINHVRDANDEASGRNDDNDNAVDNENGVDIDLGSGADFVQVEYASAVTIDAGAGADVIYTDNNAATARWVFNNIELLDQNNINNLISDDEDFINQIANLDIVVTFQDVVSQVNLVDTLGSINGRTLTDLSINQGIKAAIAASDVLSTVLEATDGPGRTLSVASNLDGLHTETDLTISLVNSTSGLTQAQITNGAQFFVNGSSAEALGFSRFDGTPIEGDRYDSEFGTNGLVDITGADSNQFNHNTVEGGEGRDIIALSSEGSVTGTGVSTETIDIDGAFGDDTLFNFKAAGFLATETTILDLSAAYTNPLGSATPGNGDNGFDIFDVSDVLGGQATAVYNNIVFGAGASDLPGALDYTERKVIIIGRVDDDPNQTDLQEIQAIARAADTVAANSLDQIVITVNPDNFGTFWYLNNGAGANDVQVERLGSIEMAQYDALDKNLIGSWEDLTIDNFVARTQGELVDLIGLA